jgi:cytochrome d ubiquinol oxidase subunit I
MIVLGVAGWWLRKRGTLYESRLFQRFTLLMGPTGFITLLAGWITTEAGRQPWVVYGVMRTSQAVSPLTAQQVGISLMAFVFVYFLVFGTGIYYLLKLMRKGPALPGAPSHDGHGETGNSDDSGGHNERAVEAHPALAANQNARRPMAAADQLIDA